MEPLTLTTEPGTKEFSNLDAARQAVPGLRVPHLLPSEAELVKARWMYPPRISTKVVNGKLQVDSIDYDLKPSLGRGHVVLVFRVPGGSLVVDQGRLAFYVSPKPDQLGPAGQLRLPSGRTAMTRQLSGSGFPPGGIRVVGWIEQDGNRFAVYVYGAALSLDQLAAIADSV